MRRMFLAVMLLAGTVGLAGCQKIHQVFDPPSSAAPLRRPASRCAKWTSTAVPLPPC